MKHIMQEKVSLQNTSCSWTIAAFSLPTEGRGQHNLCHQIKTYYATDDSCYILIFKEDIQQVITEFNSVLEKGNMQADINLWTDAYFNNRC